MSAPAYTPLPRYTRRLTELSGPAASAALTESSIVVLPTGAIEHHGEHLPLNTDVLLAEVIGGDAVERAAAAGVDVWTLPTLAYTKSDEHHWAPGTVWLDGETFAATVLQIGRAVAATGAGSLAFVNGHGGNVAVLQVALREIRRRYGLKTFLIPALRIDIPVPDDLDIDEAGMAIHGSASETSVIMHVRPELVDLDKAVRRVPAHLAEYTQIGFHGKPVSFGWLSNDFGTDGTPDAASVPGAGVIGDPTAARADYGAALFEHSVQQVADSLAEVAAFRF